MHEHKINSMLFTAKHFSMLVITERIELDTENVILKYSFPPIFRPHSLLLFFWDGFMIFLVIMAAFLLPWYTFHNIRVPMFMNVTFSFFTLLWIMDVVMQVLTAVQTKDELVVSVRNIFVHRLHSFGFFCDLVACIPIEIFSRFIHYYLI